MEKKYYFMLCIFILLRRVFLCIFFFIFKKKYSLIDVIIFWDNWFFSRVFIRDSGYGILRIKI